MLEYTRCIVYLYYCYLHTTLLQYSILKFLGRVSSVHDEYYTNKMARQHVIR